MGSLNIASLIYQPYTGLSHDADAADAAVAAAAVVNNLRHSARLVAETPSTAEFDNSRQE